MKLKNIKKAGFALAAVAALTIQSQAQVLVGSGAGGAPVGSLVLGFEQAGVASNLEVSLGAYSQFLGAGQLSGYTGGNGAFYSPGVAVTVTTGPVLLDLSGTFTANWNSNVQANLVQWGVVGINNNSAFGSSADGLLSRTVFYTVGRTDPLVQSTPPNRGSNSGQAPAAASINSLYVGLQGAEQTANDTNAGLVPTGNSNSWSSSNTGNFGNLLSSGAEQSLFGSNRGPTNSVLDLYASIPTSTTGQAPVLLGTFALNNLGVLTYTAVPEPSTYALMAIGLGALVLLRRKAKPLKVTVKS